METENQALISGLEEVPVSETKVETERETIPNLHEPTSPDDFAPVEPTKETSLPLTTIDEEFHNEYTLNSKIFKLQNRIKHMEYNIDQNRKKGEKLSQECYTLLRSTELLAFDFIFSEYLLGEAQSDEVYRFLECCIHPGFDLSTGSQEDFNKASEYVKQLQNQICKSANFILNNDLKRPDIPRRTSEFIAFLTEQKKILEQEFSNLHPQPSSLPEEPIPTETKPEELPSAFAKWLCTELKIEMEPDEESVELRSLIGSVARRLSAVSRLHDSISAMKKKRIDPEDLEYTDCDPEAIDQSPYLTGLKSSCSFLLSLFNALQIQSQFIPEAQKAIEKCTAHFQQLHDASVTAVEEMKKHINNIQRNIEEKKFETTRDDAKSKPFIEAIYGNAQLKTSPTHEYYEKLVLQQSATFQNSQNPLDEQNLQILKDIRDQRAEVDQLLKELRQLTDSVREKDRTLFELVAENCKAEIEDELHEKEIRHLKEYERNLKHIVESIIPQVKDWCDELHIVLSKLKESRIQQVELLEKQMKKLSCIDETEQKSEDLRNEINRLSQENYQLCQEVGQSKLQLDAAIEEQFRAQQEMELYKDWLPDFIDRNDDRQIQQYNAMITCPICGINRRDCILSSCGHPLCRSCVDQEKLQEKKCPKCKKPFTEADIKPFFLQ